MIGVFQSTNKVITGLSGIVFLLFLGYEIFELERSKSIDSNTRRSTKWGILLVMAMVIGFLYEKIA